MFYCKPDDINTSFENSLRFSEHPKGNRKYLKVFFQICPVFFEKIFSLNIFKIFQHAVDWAIAFIKYIKFSQKIVLILDYLVYNQYFKDV